jgi:predicted negative regulator of RcsB-dependent stress response
MTKSTSASAESTNGAPRRAPVPLGQLWQVPVFLAGILSLAVAAAASSLVPLTDVDPGDRDLTVIRQALNKPGVPSAEIVAEAESAAGHAGRDPERAGEAHFLLGAIYLRIAERKTPEVGKEEFEKAGLHLELADLRGVPAADRARLKYLLGKLAYLNGTNMPRAIDLLSQSLPGGADNAAEGYAMLVQAHLRKTPPDLDAALDANRGLLEVCDDDAMLTQARLLQGELLLKKGQRLDAIKAFEAIGAKAPAEIRFKARFLQAKASMEEGMWGKAIVWWKEVLARPDVVIPGGKARIFYNLGVCYVNFETPAHDKEAMAAWRDAQLHGGEEAQAAALRLADMNLRYGGDPGQTIEFFKEALEKVFAAADYQNSLVDLRQASDMLERACQDFDKQGDPEHFLVAAELYKKLAPPGAAEQTIGQAAEARGRELLKQAEESPDKRGALAVQALDALQKAALAYEQAAEVRQPGERLDTLWRCIECYRLGEKPEQAIAVLKKFVELPVPPERKAEAWFTLAQMQRLLKLPDARESFKQAVAFNADAFTSRALLQLADIAIEAHELADAEAVLVQVKKSSPSADRYSHELALVKLANLFFEEGKFDQAAIECKELIKQYPAYEGTLYVREQLAKCYRRIAGQAQENVNAPEIPPALKQHYQREWLESLEAARDIYQQLADDLDAKADIPGAKPGAVTLPPAEESLRRRAHFAVADCYFDLPNWFEESFKRYVRLFERYRSDPEALWACYRINRCRQLAVNSKFAPDLVLSVQEAAAASVEQCLRHLEGYERAGAFRNQEEKASWQQFLEGWRAEIRRAPSRNGG